jgi:hypothetical protein
MKTLSTLLLTTALTGIAFAQTLEVSPTGNVGVGTSTPRGKFDVVGLGGLVVAGQNLDPIIYELSWFKNTGSLLLGWNRTAGGGEIDFISNRSAGGDGGFVFYDYTNDGVLNPLMTLKGNGRIGIGTQNPSAKLSVTSEGDARLDFFSTAGSVSVINAVSNGDANVGRWLSINPTGGNVGIGNYSPYSRLMVGETLEGNAFSATLRTNAGDLGQTVNSEVSLASFGFRSANQSALGVHARRAVAGWNWESTAVGFSYDVDHTWRAGGAAIWMHSNGSVGINTWSQPTHTLTVNGEVKSKGYFIDTSNWSDYVFADDYKLASLDEVEKHIKKNGHLPGVPSEAEVVSKGLDLGKMSAVQMAKIEELMLHVIALNKKMDAQAAQVKAQAEEIRLLKSSRKDQ